MKPNAKTALIATAALLLGGAGLAVVAGQQTQRDVQAQLGRTQKALNDSGIAKMESGPFQGNALGGTQVTKITLMPTSADPLEVTLTSRVYNGPFPQGKAFGAATVVTDVSFPPEIQKPLDKAFGGQKIQLRTLVKFGGNSVTTYHVPAGQFTDDGMKASWKAASGTVSTLGEKITGSGQWPGLTMEGEGNLVTVGAARWTMSGDNASDGLGNARSSMTLGNVAATMDGKPVFAMGPLTVESDVKSDAKLVTSSVKYHLAKATFQDTTLDNVQLNLSFKNLDRKALTQLSSLDTDAKDFDPQAMEPILKALMAASPTLSLDRLSVGSGKDEVVITGAAALKASPDTDWSMALLAPATLMSAVKVNAHAEGERQAVERLAALFAPDADTVTTMLDMATEQGMLVQKGTRLVSDVQFDDQGVKVNGQTME
ncbi:DUF945 family protein [Deinococcus ficus]|uniref:DUF945 domain-containing protein n=1 Tax=Deinococcus ficus TaxID=317577 RepID=A0A221T366_9DEIO|nr:DUF945 family protein [Deinococcus ficus]ASN83367.1 hypothetical protein DFI_19410 [Deinococcus ficus]